MAAPQITLYFDIVSPFAYLAFNILRKSPTFSKCNITYVPIFLGGLMNTCGTVPPIRIKNKDKWIETERVRWVKYFQIPMVEKVPAGFPAKTVDAQRALCSIQKTMPDKFVDTIEEIYRWFWLSGNVKVGQREMLAPVLEGVLGKKESEQILETINQDDIKAILTSNTEHAFKIGAFGLPWFECTDVHGKTEGFWGIDHLGQVADFLGLDRSLDNGFKAVL